MTQEVYADDYGEGIKIMVQKTSVQKAAAKPRKKYPVLHGAASAEIEIPRQAAPSGIQQDDDLWDAAIENSMEAIRELADKALADRQAGRTKKITI